MGEARPELVAGTLVGSYRLRELLGEGGMGRVYVAEHVRLGKQFALKILREELATNPSAVSRFFAEARAVTRISHENIVEVTDCLELPGTSCFVMELLHGEDLGVRLRRQRLPLATITDIGAQIASGLAAAHAAGIIHRDLKPDNVFLVDRSPARSPTFVKLLDFGVAKLVDQPAEHGIALHSTAAGQIIGTPAYMSPEQACGMGVDHRTDLYALGVILYEMISGAVPFEAAHFGELIVQQMTTRARPIGELADIPPALDALVMALLEKDIAARPRSMAEVEAALVMIQRELPPSPRPSGPLRLSDSAPVRRMTPVDEFATAQTIDVGAGESARIRLATPPRGISAIRAPASGRVPSSGGSPSEAAPLPPGADAVTLPKRPLVPSRTRLAVLLAALVASAVFGGWVQTRRARDADADADIAPRTSVRVRFTSKPPGATVTLAGTTLGITPFVTALPRRSGSVQVVIVKPGFASATEDVDTERDSTLSVSLAPR